MKCYHGTTEKHLLNILSGNCKETSTWYCSSDDMLYVYPESKADEDQNLIWSALESAQLTAAKDGHNKIVCIELEIPDDLLQDDLSCDNMSDIASCCELESIKEYITAIYSCDDYNPSLRPFYLAHMLGNYQFNQDDLDFQLREAIGQISKADIHLELFPEDYDIATYTYL